jgi:hypothetical protein
MVPRERERERERERGRDRGRQGMKKHITEIRLWNAMVRTEAPWAV